MKRTVMALALVASVFVCLAGASAFAQEQTNGHAADPTPGVTLCGHGASAPVSVPAGQPCPSGFYTDTEAPAHVNDPVTVVTEPAPRCPDGQYWSSMSPGGCFVGRAQPTWTPPAPTTTTTTAVVPAPEPMIFDVIGIMSGWLEGVTL